MTTLGEHLFTLLRTHEIAREPVFNRWLALPERRRREYEEAALEIVAEHERRAKK